METRHLGKTDLRVTVLGFGGAEIGFEQAGPKQVEDLLNRALDEGMNVIDTARMYLASEEMIGKAVSHRRDEFYLFTKCGQNGLPESEMWKPVNLMKDIEASLKLLKTDYLDLVQLHSCSLDVLKHLDAITTLQKAKEKGYTRYIGYSGEEEAAKFACETEAFDTLQTSVNIADQRTIDYVLPVAKQKRMGVIAKRPIANAVWKHKTKPDNAYHHEYWDRIQKLNYEFLRGEVNDGVSTALRFTLTVPEVDTAIVGTTKPDRWSENAEYASRGTLTVEEFARIRQVWKQVAPPDWLGQV
ncbi:MAG: hypothetical protein AMXMBFR84_38180 [Candidatus Hydrogenedentota bacterium]